MDKDKEKKEKRKAGKNPTSPTKKVSILEVGKDPKEFNTMERSNGIKPE